MIIKYTFDRKNLLYFLALILCILLGIGIRLYFIESQSISLDEAQSIWQAGHPLSGNQSLFVVMARDIHPPLFNIILHFWMEWFGEKAYILRLIPLFFGICTIPAMYGLVRELFRPLQALFASFLVSIGPLWVWYSLNIKNYSFLVLFSTLSLLFYFKIIHNKHIGLNATLYMVVQALGLYTHYLFVFVILVEIVGSIIYKRLSILFFNFCASLFFIPWALFFLQHHSSSTQPSLGTLNLFNIILSYFELLFGYHSDAFYRVAISLWPVFILCMFIYIPVFKKFSNDMVVLIIGLVLPVVISYILSIFLTRYVLYATVFIYILLAFACTSAKKPVFRYIGMVVVSGVLFFATMNQMNDPLNISSEDYRGAIQYIETTAKQHDLIVISAPFIIYPFDYYYSGKVDYTTLPYWNRKTPINFAPSPEQMSALVSSANNHYAHIILLESYDQTHTNATVKWFGEHLKTNSHKPFGYNVAVYEYSLPNTLAQRD